MKFSLNTGGLPQANIFEKIKMASSCGYDAIEPWFNELSRQSLTEIKDCLKKNNVVISSIEQLRGWFELDGSAMGDLKNDWQAILGECERRMIVAKELNCPYIVAAPPIDGKGSLCSFESGAERFKELIKLGKQIGVLPAIEFCGQTSRIRDVSSCLKFIELVNDPDCKIIIDAYHLWRCGNDMSQVLWFKKSDISLLHISDANPNIDRQTHRDGDRIIPGDGCIGLRNFFKMVKSFQGYVSMGVYNTKIWEKNPLQTGIRALNQMKEMYESSYLWD